MADESAEADGRRRRRPKVLGRLRRAVVLVVAVVLALGLGFGAATVTNAWDLDFWSRSSDSQVVQSIEFSEDITLLKLGVQGIDRVSGGSTFIKWHVPGTGTAQYVQYKFTANLGVDGSQVTIDKIAENRYRITVPEFEFLSNSDPEFETAVEDDGVISFINQDDDDAVLDAVNVILNSETKSQYVTDNRQLLELQCETFYTNIVRAIDPTIELEFVYAGD